MVSVSDMPACKFDFIWHNLAVMRKRNSFIKFILCLAIAALAVLFFAVCVHSTVHKTKTFVIKNGDSVTAVASQLRNQHLVISDRVFMFLVRLRGGRVQSGEYDIPRGASLWRVVDMFVNGKVATTRIVIPEGLTIIQIKELLLASKDLVGDAWCDDMRGWGAVCDLSDGDVFPDTYYVARGTARMAVLSLAHKKMEKIKNKWLRSRKNPPAPLKNWNDVITLASIVQRETPRASEMKIVAGVYLNRLRRGIRLQADPTVVYALTNGYGDMRGEPLLRGHLKIDSPYNTYRHGGLPPAPIANVGLSAIRAVLDPAETKYLYFVADGQGGHRFSVDYDAHIKNHADWREIKQQNNPGLNFVGK